MMKKRRDSKPTDAECTILAAIWVRGAATVREVHGDLKKQQDIGYTTVLKFMQIMHGKGLLKRDESVRPQVYRPARTRKQTQKALLGDLLDRAFYGSAGQMVLQALSMKHSTPEELRQIRELLDKLEDEQ